MRAGSRWMVAVAVGVIAVASVPQGHTPIASRFTYNEHLFPIFRDRCGACHIEGGVAPMSLVVYQSAYPWTQSIREEVMGLRMPPWQAEDGFGDFQNGHVLAAHEMDMILEWSAGGYPQGPRDQAPSPPELETGWSQGEPDLALEMASPFVLDAGTSEAVRYFVLPSGITEDQLLAGVDFVPGARAVVRGAAIFIDGTGTARQLDESDPQPGFAAPDDGQFPDGAPAAIFTPGQPAVLTPDAGYPVAAGSDIVLRVHYKKTWITEGSEFSDQSRVGLHFTDVDAAAIASVMVTSPAEVDGRELVFSHDVADDVTLLALLPEVDIDSSELIVEGVTPDGDRLPMLWLREPDNGWPTRFWFDAPVSLPGGSRIEVTALIDAAPERHSGGSLLGVAGAPIRISVDYLPGTAAVAN